MQTRSFVGLDIHKDRFPSALQKTVGMAKCALSESSRTHPTRSQR